MREHPEIGERICDPLRMSRDFTPIIRHHHERWDGRGYPDGLKGEAIPLGARIVALADAFDAIVRGRPYRPARAAGRGVRRAPPLRRHAVRPGPRAALHRGGRPGRVGRAAQRGAATRGAARRRAVHRCPATRAVASVTAARRPPARDPRRRGPEPVRYHVVRLVLQGSSSAAYVRMRVEGAEQLPPDGPLHHLLQPPQLARPDRSWRPTGPTGRGASSSSGRASGT